MKRILVSLAGLCLVAGAAVSQEHFETSLHATRHGKPHWYNAENGGFETLTNVPIEDMGCVNCHGPTNALGEANGEDYEPGCNDCHAADFSVSQSQCLTCHGRQAMEAVTMGIPDVHRDAGMVCWDCHSSEDIHGDGTEYQTQFEPGAIKAACVNCHTETPEGHAAFDPHEGKLACESCHASTVISCYNCHLESQVEAHNKRAKQPIRDFVILANREETGQVSTASFQSLTYQGDGWVAFGPYVPHTITREGRTCTDCHANMGGSVEAIEQYNATGEIRFASLADDGTMSWMKGVVPMPADYQQSWKMDFITYDGDVTDAVGPSAAWSRTGKDSWDGHQMLYISPLTPEQMAKMGFSGVATAVTQVESSTPSEFALTGNFPNPFNSATTIRYTVDVAGPVRLEVFDAAGQRLASLVAEHQMPGTYEATWDGLDPQGRPAGTGTYLARLSLGESTATSKMMLVK